MDAFSAAFKTPNLLRDLFAEGALSTAFITTFSKKIEREGEPAAWRLANKIGSLLLVVMSLIVVLGILLAPALLSITVRGFLKDPENSTSRCCSRRSCSRSSFSSRSARR
jgi:putative peptidoglycan lipid II flippase